MKQILLALMAVCGCGAFAAFQFELVDNGEDRGRQGIHGQSYTLNVIEGSGKVYISDVLGKHNNGNFKISLNPPLVIKNNQFSEMVDVNAASFGTYDVGTDNRSYGSSSDTIALQNYKGDEVTGYLLGSFNAGDSVGIWITSNYNDSNVTGISAGDRTDYTSPEFFYRAIEGNRMDNSGKNVGIIGYKSDFFHHGEGVRYELTGVEGQPLPGVLAVLLFGAGACGYAKLRKRS